MTISRHALLTALTAIAGFSAANAAELRPPVAAKKPQPKLSAANAQSLVYLAADRIVVIRLYLFVDGKDHRTAWNERIEKYFQQLDGNGDGALTGNEINAIPSGLNAWQWRPQPTGNIVGSQTNTIGRSMADSNPRDGQVTLKELKAYLRRAGIRPFSVQMPGDNNSRRNRVITFGSARTADEAGKKLFDRLDRDGDGKLAREELLAASKSLRKSDLDDDELISTAELSGPRTPIVTAASMSRPSGGNNSAFLSLSSNVSVVQTVRRLIRQYDKNNGDGKLSAGELGIDESACRRFDADGDGSLDFTELRQFLRKPPAGIELVVQLGQKRRGGKPIQLIRVQPGLKSRVKEVAAHLANLALSDSQIDIAIRDTGSTSWSVSASSYERQFKAADTDNNGYLERRESRRFSVFRNAFDQMDTDHDGKVFKKEALAYFRRQENLAKSQTALAISDQGRDLFKILDLDRDQRLSAGELEGLLGRIAAWDNDADGAIAKSEIPQQYRLALTRGRSSGNFTNVAVATAANPRRGRPPVSNRGPKWFTRMDLNGDGEVSRREFLGPRKLFGMLDSNHNGRLDRAEAEQAASAAAAGRSGNSNP